MISIVSIIWKKSVTHLFSLSIYLDFTDSIDFYRKIHLFFRSSKNDNWFHANSKFVDNWVAIERQRIKQFIITFFEKKILKNLNLFFKTHFKVFFGWPILARFLFFPVFHDLDPLPFQDNLCRVPSAADTGCCALEIGKVSTTV